MFRHTENVLKEAWGRRGGWEMVALLLVTEHQKKQKERAECRWPALRRKVTGSFSNGMCVLRSNGMWLLSNQEQAFQRAMG